MLATYVQRGESLDYIPAEDVAAGDIVIRNRLAGVAKLDIRAGTLGALAICGVFDIVKGSIAFRAGDRVYWDATNRVATTTSPNPCIGKAVAEAPEAEATVRVLLNAPGSYSC